MTEFVRKNALKTHRTTEPNIVSSLSSALAAQLAMGGVGAAKALTRTAKRCSQSWLRRTLHAAAVAALAPITRQPPERAK